ncbi:hypothetical protein IA539_14090 [Gordonia sp. zg691]|uniref:Uncharacterized protein n=1 Tax=Gordonia jinghuaiqii TaxID=2758710 RepID=A0A7D7LUS4_9ACTN|nr:hypothetical protein [Gordonia jinghuaiqii]MBD0862338.1 hypothetical protein [Gordonia jinghuaiqii]MCR5978438.1 hypothetical protein [Gordonia jinghuaiqii]QMT02777.1 hypothetical protein H1R19_06480 [Gordonia jinghuaiqii]
MTIALILLALVLLAGVVALVYRTRRTPPGTRTPLQRLSDWLTRAPERPYGPDTDRVTAELSILTRRYDKLI